MVIEAHLVDAKGALVDPSVALENSTGVPLQLSVVQAGTNTDYSNQFALTATGVPGIYRAEGRDLPGGEYNVTVAMVPNLPLRTNYMVADPQGQAAGAIRLVENWWWVGLLAAIGFVSVGTVTGTALGLVRNHQASQHPAKGTLQIVNEFGLPTWARTMNGRNHLVFKQLPATTHIKRLEVRCNTDDESKRGVVQVTAILDDGTPVRGTLAPGPQRLPLGRYKFYLTKPN
jgi:hypothetical protein